MTAGTVVITGGILATAILLTIIAVLCYCRLQYYCCKNNGSETGSVSQTHVSCNACSAAGLDGPMVTPLSLSPEPPPSAAAISPPPHTYCPTCSPYDSPYYIRTTDETRNGGERITYMPTYYENQALALALPPLPPLHGSLLGPGRPSHYENQALALAMPSLPRARHPAPPDFYTNTHAISTEV